MMNELKCANEEASARRQEDLENDDGRMSSGEIGPEGATSK